jgi:BCD family chlorophyll transporter-like MFS transporter
MILVAVAGAVLDASRTSVLRGWMIAGCLGSALALLAIAGTGALLPLNAFKGLVFALGFANGIFAAAAIGAMMALATASGSEGGRDGTRIGLWGAAQAIAFGLGGLVGTGTADIARAILGSATSAYATVFALEALAFVAAAIMAASATSARPHAIIRPVIPTEPASPATGGLHATS